MCLKKKRCVCVHMCVYGCVFVSMCTCRVYVCVFSLHVHVYSYEIDILHIIDSSLHSHLHMYIHMYVGHKKSRALYVSIFALLNLYSHPSMISQR